MCDKPEGLEEYIEWVDDELGYDLDGEASSVYRTNVRSVKQQIEDSEVYESMKNCVYECSGQYKMEKGTDLRMGGTLLEVHMKPYKSVVSKCYRENCIYNQNFPNEPDGGWVTPVNLFSKLNDVVRTKITCKYADGPRYLFECFRELFDNGGIDFRYYTSATDKGHYAHHIYPSLPVEIYDLEEGTKTVYIEFEILINTQLKELISKITHSFYKEDRHREDSSDNWKWEMRSDKFKSAYMNHALHLLESVILELRDGSLDDEQT